MSHIERRPCGHCINGFVLTGVGRKPCPYCLGKGYLTLEVEDDQEDDLDQNTDYFDYSNPSSHSSSSYNPWDTHDPDENRNSDSGFRPLGCLITIVVIYLMYKHTSIIVDMGASFYHYLAVFAVLYMGKKLSFK
jgi:hypothetical protein